MSTLSDKIALDALKVQSASNDGVTVVRRSLKDQIEADKYARDLSAAGDIGGSLRNMISVLVPPGGH